MNGEFSLFFCPPTLVLLLICCFRWLKSPTFGTWLAQQEQIVQTVLNDPLLPFNSVATIHNSHGGQN